MHSDGNWKQVDHQLFAVPLWLLMNSCEVHFHGLQTRPCSGKVQGLLLQLLKEFQIKFPEPGTISEAHT